MLRAWQSQVLSLPLSNPSKKEPLQFVWRSIAVSAVGKCNLLTTPSAIWLACAVCVGRMQNTQGKIQR